MVGDLVNSTALVLGGQIIELYQNRTQITAEAQQAPPGAGTDFALIVGMEGRSMLEVVDGVKTVVPINLTEFFRPLAEAEQPGSFTLSWWAYATKEVSGFREFNFLMPDGASRLQVAQGTHNFGLLCSPRDLPFSLRVYTCCSDFPFALLTIHFSFLLLSVSLNGFSDL